MKTADIRICAEHAYSVKVGHHIADLLSTSSWATPNRNALLLCTQDSQPVANEVRDFASAAGMNVTVVEVPRGEETKSLSTVQNLWDSCAQASLDRAGLIIAVGGGTVTDVAGFVAATWMRGVDWVAIPTTTAGMVDAAIGGKTGINAAGGKNLVGAFHSPVEVLCATSTLRTLPRADYAAGLVEAVKCGLIADTTIVQVCSDAGADIFDCDSPALAEIVTRAIEVKANVVNSDFKEQGTSTGVSREILNYGHTFGHALEAESGYLMRHGDAVAIGMVFAAELSEALGHAPAGLAESHRTALAVLHVPTSHRQDNLDEMVALMRRDKKARAGVLRFVLLRAAGDVFMCDTVERSSLDQAFQRTRETGV